MDFDSLLKDKCEQGILPPHVAENAEALLGSFRSAITHKGHEKSAFDHIVNPLLEGCCQHLAHPFTFDHFHQRLRHPVDYFQLGVDYVNELILWDQSSVQGEEQLKRMITQLENGENVILMGNHQAEVDPQILSALLMDKAPRIAHEVIFVAGHRVTTDPVAVPFSVGRNLLCIHSKRHIDHPPHEREQKQHHNQRTMREMARLLAEGGACIYVAPSGGRDRPNEEGKIEVADFDPQAIEMFLLMAKKAKRPSHFYPLTLVTYQLMPPPLNIRRELGEKRIVHCSAVHAAFAEEFEDNHFPGSTLKDKRERRQARAKYLHGIVNEAHERLSQRVCVHTEKE